MAYKVFTNGSVLNASEINDNLMNQSVMVFSNSTARAAALTTPVEGMLTWLQDLNLYENYNGSAWVALTNSGLDLIKVQTIGTAVSSVAVTSAFSSTYDAYKIVVAGGVASTTNSRLLLKLGAASNGHNSSVIYNQWNSTLIAAISSSNLAQFDYVGSANTDSLACELTLVNPFLTKTTYGTGLYSDSLNGGMIQVRHTGSTSFTDFTITTPGGVTMTGGTIAVYGYKKA